MVFVRKVRTASGAVAVQVMRKAGRRDDPGRMSVLLIPMLSWGFCSNGPAGSPPGSRRSGFEVPARDSARRLMSPTGATGTLTLSRRLSPRVPRWRRGAPRRPFAAALRRDRRRSMTGLGSMSSTMRCSGIW